MRATVNCYDTDGVKGKSWQTIEQDGEEKEISRLNVYSCTIGAVQLHSCLVEWKDVMEKIATITTNNY